MKDSFFKELLKRKVFRGIALYVVAAWLLMQAGEIVLPAFGLPDSALRILIITLVAGLPIAALLSWAFEFSTSGIRRERNVVREPQKPGKFSRSVDFAIIGVLTVLVGYFGWHYFTTGSPVPEVAAAEPSIAVLPFVNMSGDQSNEYFSDGISEELLNALAKVPGLKVAGRTSSFSYKGKNQDLRIIGEQLGVATVLEGSVRKANDRVRVTAQLVKTSDGFHLWSDTFDYQLDDIFKVQDEIAAAVVTELKGRLLGVEIAPTPENRKTDANTYAFYLQGRDALHERRKETIVGAESLFKQALAIDPDFAPAWVGLAESYMLQHVNHKLIPLQEAETKADEAIARALELDPESSEAYAALGLTRMEASRLDEAEAALSRSLELNPGYAEAYHWYGILHRARGEYDAAYLKLAKSVDLDPLHRVARLNFGKLLLLQDKFEEATEFFKRSTELTPEHAPNFAVLAGIHALGPMPDPAAAIQYVDQAIKLDPETGDYRHYKVSIQLEAGDLIGARDTLRQSKESLPQAPINLVSEYAIASYSGNSERGIETLISAAQANADLNDNFRNAILGIAYTLTGDFDEALNYLLAVDPQLQGPEPSVNSDNLQFAKMIAVSHYSLGNQQEKERYLAAIEEHMGFGSRFGPDGYHLADVEVALLREQDDEAMRRFQLAYDEGFRNRTLEGIWRLADYPGFTALRDRADFQALVEKIEQYHRNLARSAT